jgi:hypothetical protein
VGGEERVGPKEHPRDVREDKIVSKDLTDKARVFGNEVGWSGDYIEAALRGIADAERVVLGFDIVEMVRGGKLTCWGTSAFDMGPFLQSKSWKECVVLSRELALKDVCNTQRLTGLKAPYSDLWYLVVTVGPEEAAELTLPNATLNVTRKGDSKPTTLTIPVKIQARMDEN